MIHQHLLSPALAEPFPSPSVQVFAAPPLAVPGCGGAQGDLDGCPQGHHLKMTGCTSTAGHAVAYSRLLSRARAHAEVLEILPPRQGQHYVGEISLPYRWFSRDTRGHYVTPSFPAGVFQKPSRLQPPHQKSPGHATFPPASAKTQRATLQLRKNFRKRLRITPCRVWNTLNSGHKWNITQRMCLWGKLWLFQWTFPLFS